MCDGEKKQKFFHIKSKESPAGIIRALKRRYRERFAAFRSAERQKRIKTRRLHPTGICIRSKRANPNGRGFTRLFDKKSSSKKEELLLRTVLPGWRKNHVLPAAKGPGAKASICEREGISKYAELFLDQRNEKTFFVRQLHTHMPYGRGDALARISFT